MEAGDASDSEGEVEVDDETYGKQIEALAKLSGIEFSKVESGMVVEKGTSSPDSLHSPCPLRFDPKYQGLVECASFGKRNSRSRHV